MGVDALEHLRGLVIDDTAARVRLLAAPDREAFVAEVVEVARERGIELSAAQVVAGLDAARRRHRERWV
jgi:post-segregation antitoxin (ccd killing protein)